MAASTDHGRRWNQNQDSVFVCYRTRSPQRFHPLGSVDSQYEDEKREQYRGRSIFVSREVGERRDQDLPSIDEEADVRPKKSFSWSHHQSGRLRHSPLPIPSLPNGSKTEAGVKEEGSLRQHGNRPSRKSVAFDELAVDASLPGHGSDHWRLAEKSAASPDSGPKERADKREGYPSQLPIKSDEPLKPLVQDFESGAEIEPDIPSSSAARAQSKHSSAIRLDSGSCAEDIPLPGESKSGSDPIDLVRPHSHQRQNRRAVRRKNMRTVSQDDYLLVRGANPRTGLVTPSIHSGSDSLDEAEWSRIKATSQPTKWRLTGDQWVSIGLDEPTPLPSPPRMPVQNPYRRPLRVPPKLAGKNPRTGTTLAGEHGRKQTEKLSQKHSGQGPDPANPDSAQDDVLKAVSSGYTKEHSSNEKILRRKPLAPPSKQALGQNSLSTRPRCEASTETVITRPGTCDEKRASSMPTPQKFRFFGPNDVGRELPPLPKTMNDDDGDVFQDSSLQQKPFLDMRPESWIEDVPSWANQKDERLRCGRPCLPMKDIPSQSPPWENQFRSPRPLMKFSPNHPRIAKGSQESPAGGRGGASQREITFPRSRPKVVPQQQLATHTPHMLQQQHHQPDGGSKSIHKSGSDHLQPQKADPSISTSEGVTLTPQRGGQTHQNQTSQSTITHTTTPTTMKRTSTDDTLVDSSWREIPSSPARKDQNPEQAIRPAMRGRAEGMHNVPQASLPNERQRPRPWKTTGTSDGATSTASTSKDASAERDLILRALRPSHENKALPARPMMDLAGSDVKEGEGQAVKSYPNCNGHCSAAGLRNTDGSPHAPKDRPMENTDTQLGKAYDSKFVTSERGDHDSCCPECCAIGCHRSCLGHKSPSGATVNGYGVVGNLSAVKQAFRNSVRLNRRIRVRTGAGGAHETEAEETAELETPMLWGVRGRVGPQLSTSQDRQLQVQESYTSTHARCICSSELLMFEGVAAVLGAAWVPFAAFRMWLGKHPQLPVIMQVITAKILDMTRHVIEMIWKIYHTASIYAETGVFEADKGTSSIALTRDCVKAVLYCLILMISGMIIVRSVLVVATALRWLVWSLSLVTWVFRAVGWGLP